MKKSKLLIPFAALAGTAAIAVPMMSMTSCAQGEKEVTDTIDFQGDIAESETNSQHVVINRVLTEGSYILTFKHRKDMTAAEAADMKIEIICKSTSSPITMLRCITTYDEHASPLQDFTATISFSVDPASITEDGVKMEYDVKVHNGTWYKMFTGYTLTVKKPA